MRKLIPPELSPTDFVYFCKIPSSMKEGAGGHRSASGSWIVGKAIDEVFWNYFDLFWLMIQNKYTELCYYFILVFFKLVYYYSTMMQFSHITGSNKSTKCSWLIIVLYFFELVIVSPAFLMAFIC